MDNIAGLTTLNLFYLKNIESPIFVNNALPDYYNFDYVLNFLEKVIDA